MPNPKFSPKQLKAMRLAGIALIANEPPDEIKRCLVRLMGAFPIPAKLIMSATDLENAMELRQLRDI